MRDLKKNIYDAPVSREDAARLGAFEEDAIGEDDAVASMDDPCLDPAVALKAAGSAGHGQ